MYTRPTKIFKKLIKGYENVGKIPSLQSWHRLCMEGKVKVVFETEKIIEVIDISSNRKRKRHEEIIDTYRYKTYCHFSF